MFRSKSGAFARGFGASRAFAPTAPKTLENTRKHCWRSQTLLFTAPEPLGTRKYRSGLLGVQLSAQKCRSGLARDPQSAQKCRSGLPWGPQSAQKCRSGLPRGPQSAQKCRSGLPWSHQGARKCRSGLSRGSELPLGPPSGLPVFEPSVQKHSRETVRRNF